MRMLFPWIPEWVDWNIAVPVAATVVVVVVGIVVVCVALSRKANGPLQTRLRSDCMCMAHFSSHLILFGFVVFSVLITTGLRWIFMSNFVIWPDTNQKCWCESCVQLVGNMLPKRRIQEGFLGRLIDYKCNLTWVTFHFNSFFLLCIISTIKPI